MRHFPMPSAVLMAFMLVAVPFGAQAAPTPDKKVLDLCEQAKPGLVKLTETLVNMDSGTDDYPELLAKQAFLERELKKRGAEVQVVPAPAPREGTNNLVATWKGTGKARIMYMGHYDTVWPKGTSAKRPFHVKDNIMHGPGVADMQAGLAGILTLIDVVVGKLGERNFAVITVMFNADEEKGSFGSRDLIMDLASRHDVVYSFEGGGEIGDRLTISARGTAYYRMHVKGRESHSGAAPEKGVNAGYEMAYQMMRMRDLTDKSIGTDVNWTMGQFGTKSNVIPGAAWAEANVRISRTSEFDRIEKDMSERIKDKLFPETEITIDFRRGRPPFEKNTVTDGLAAKAAQIFKDELGRDLSPRASGGAADSNYSSQKAPTLEGCGLGGKGYHALDEQLSLDNITPRLYLMVRLAQETMKGGIVPLKGS